MLTLEVDPESGCGGGCTGCALSRVNMSTNLPASRVKSVSALQSVVIESTLATFTRPHEIIHVNISGCLMNYTDANIPKFPNRTLKQVTLYLESEEYDPQKFFDQLSLFLSAYPKLQTLRISFFRGTRYVAQQVQALRGLMAGMISFLNSSSLDNIELYFGANDISPDDRSFDAVDGAFTYVFDTGITLFRDDGTFSESRNAIKRDAFVIDDRFVPGNGELQRVIALIPKKIGKEKYLYVGYNFGTAQPKEMTAEDMLKRIGNINKPGVMHIGWNRVFPFHYAEFTQIPGAHVSYKEYLKMLELFRSGGLWSEIVSAPIRERMA